MKNNMTAIAPRQLVSQMKQNIASVTTHEKHSDKLPHVKNNMTMITTQEKQNSNNNRQA